MNILPISWVQGTAANRPYVLPASVNGLDVADFRANQWLAASQAVSAFFAPNTDVDVEVSFPFWVDVGTASTCIFDSPSHAAVSLFRLQILSSTRLTLSYRTTSLADTSVSSANNTYSTGAWQVARIIKQGTDLTLHNLGTQIATRTNCRSAIVSSADGSGGGSLAATIGARTGGGSPYDGKFAEPPMINKGILTTQERADQDAYYEAKYGVSIA